MAPEYDLSPLQPSTMSLLISLLRRIAPDRILAPDCHDGTLAAAVQDSVGQPVTAVDRSPWNVELARAKGVCAGVGEPAALPFADGSYDCAILGRTDPAHLCDDTLYELERVLRPGGTLLAVEPRPPGCRPRAGAPAGRDMLLTLESAFTDVEVQQPGGGSRIYLARTSAEVT